MLSAFKDTPTSTPLYRLLFVCFLSILFVACDDDKPVTYSVTFDTAGGEPKVASQSVKSGERVQAPDVEPSKPDSVFNVWVNAATGRPYIFSSPVTTDLILKAVYAKAYKVTFDTEGVGELTAQTVEQGKTATRPPTDPKKTGYTFDGWYTDNTFATVFDFDNTPIVADTKVFGRFTINAYTVSFDTDGGSAVEDQTVDYNDNATRPNDPTKTGHTFDGWYADDTFATEFDFDNTAITQDTVVYAKLTPFPSDKYAVTFDTDGGSSVTAQLVDKTAPNNKAARPAADPTKTGYTFDGWYADNTFATVFDFDNTLIVADTKVFAKFTINAYTVSFDTDGGSAVEDQSVDYNHQATKPLTDPTKTGYTFEGWYTDNTFAAVFDFDNTPIVAATKVFAKFTLNSYTVSFDTDGGSDVTSQTIAHGNKATRPGVPTKPNHFFEGWYTDNTFSTAFNFATVAITSDTKVFAKLTSIPAGQFVVYFDTQGGSVVPAQLVNDGDKVMLPAAPTKSGHYFMGDWYTDAASAASAALDAAASQTAVANKFDVNAPITQNITLYAFFKTIEKPQVGSTRIQIRNLRSLIDKGQADARIGDTGDFNWIDVSEMTSMFASFSTEGGPFRDNTTFNGDISKWDVSNVTNMRSMFRKSTAFNQPLNDWNVGKVTNMSSMFENATAFNQDLNDWDVSNVTDMRYMFSQSTAFNQPLNDWNVVKVTNMAFMFNDALAFNQPLNDWDVDKVKTMESMFGGAASFNQDLSDWDVGNVTNMGLMFSRATSFNQNIGGWDVGNVTNMRLMFSFATSFNQDLSSWDVSKVTNSVSFDSRATAWEDAKKPKFK